MATSSFWTQYKILIWKNFLLKKRNKKSTIYEVVLPLYFIGILIVVRLTAKPETLPKIGPFEEHSFFNGTFNPSSQDFVDKYFIVTPDTNETRHTMTAVVNMMEQLFSLPSPPDVHYFANNIEAEDAFTQNKTNVLAGIVFNHTSSSATTTDSMSYAIRMPYSNVPETDLDNLFTDQSKCRLNDRSGLNKDNCDSQKYLYSGFAALQAVIDTALVRSTTGKTSLSPPIKSILMLPKPEFTPDSSYLQTISSIYFVIAYSPFVNTLTVHLVAEKEKKIKEGMKMMGLRDPAFWLSWASVYMLIIGLVSAVVTIIALVSQFFLNSNVFLFFLLLLFYGFTILGISFMLAPFFNKARTAGGLASLASMVFSLLYIAVSQTRTITPGSGSVSYSVPVWGRWLMCLFSPTAFALGIDQAIYLDLRGGMNFSTLTDGEFPLYAPLLMLIVDTIIYFVLAFYFDMVIPGEYGPRYKPYFLFTKSFWISKKKESSSVSMSNQYLFNLRNQGDINSYTTPVADSHVGDVEAIPTHMKNKAAIRISKLSKEFKSKEGPVKAVNELSLTIYADQITAILGHNGAGKTTTMNILTGLVGPTSGNASILGLDVSDTKDMEEIRSMTGVCPQHNILFDELTCNEHLILYAILKGVPADQVEKEMNEALTSVDLSDQANVVSVNLSGGQKRKLSVAIAIIGDPKIIFLDEPTAGMDPYSRRHLWSVLKNKRKGRIIVLTTHFMDEADILADRKAIISKGALRCYGSSLFLKNRFGIGYHLNMVVEPNSDTQKINDVVSNVVPGAEINRIHGREVDITLPLNALSNFPQLFTVLENKTAGQENTAANLGISSYGVSMTTLEEVFLKLEEEENEENSKELKKSDLGINPAFNMNEDTPIHNNGAKMKEVNIDLQSNFEDPSLEIECITDEKMLLWQRFKAMFWIQFLKTIRFKRGFLFQSIVPVVLIIVGLVVSKTVGRTQPKDYSKPTPLAMSPAYYIEMNNISQYFPYQTIPRLLLRDSASTSASQSFLASLKTLYSTYDETNAEHLNPDLLFEQSPFYVGVNLSSLDVTTPEMSYTAMFNDSAVNSVPVTINMMSNALLALLTGALNSTITVSSLPWPSDDKKPVFDNNLFTSIMLIGMGFVFIPGGLALFIVQDRQTKVRSQLRISGMPFFAYWAGCFCVDFIKFMIPAVLTIIVVYIANVEAMTPGGAAVSFILVVLAFVPANVLFSYFTSFMYDKWETCQTVHTFLIFLVGYFPFLPVSIIDMVGYPDTAFIIHAIGCVLFPPYTIFGGLYYINRVYQNAFFTGGTDSITFGDYFKFSNNIVICYLMNIVHIFVLFFLLRVMDIRKTGGDMRDVCPVNTRRRNSKVIPGNNEEDLEDEEEDVAEERLRVKHLIENNETPVGMVQNLRKEFRKEAKKSCKKVPKKDKVKVAVRNATFAVNVGEVLGLLGPNGAGKTTLLSMMTADIGPDKGKVTVGGHDIRSSLSDAFQAMGYCPQHDALWEMISLREHLECFALIRGIPKESCEELIDFFIKNLKLGEHEKKHAMKLSGGTKRKLCYIMSMLGRPKIVLFDEPSTGMDPQSKRFLWNTISGSFENTERGAVLTTHYMEEADALCSRIAIMVNGRIECLGSSQHLKTKYGSAYQLEVKLTLDSNMDEAIEERMKKLERFIIQLFPNAICMEQFGERAMFKIPRENISSLAKAFTNLEEGKVHHSIEEYSFSQATLEQVFLEFAKKQLDVEQTEEEHLLSKQRSLSQSIRQRQVSVETNSTIRL